MDRLNLGRLACGIASLTVIYLIGCQPIRVPAELELQGAFRTYTVEAGVPTTGRGVVNSFDSGGIELGGGSLRIEPDAITVTPANNSGGKAVALQQQAQTSTLTITAHIAPAAEEETVCETGETYGPFEVTLDEDYVPIAIDPSSFTLSSTTLDLLTLGQFSLCLTVVSPVDGVVTIDQLVFNVGL